MDTDWESEQKIKSVEENSSTAPAGIYFATFRSRVRRPNRAIQIPRVESIKPGTHRIVEEVDGEGEDVVTISFVVRLDLVSNSVLDDVVQLKHRQAIV